MIKQNKLRKMKQAPSKTFCILPWMHMAVTQMGLLKVCCQSISSKNLILKPDGSPYKIYKDSLEEIWNSEFYQNIRQALLKGEKPSMCQWCFKKEDVMSKSLRQKMNEYWAMLDINKEETNPPLSNIRYLELNLGNKCNLKCRMCNPYSSNQMLKEWKGLSKEVSSTNLAFVPENKEEYFKKFEWTSKINFKKITEDLSFLELIYIKGGEPFIIEEHFDLLELLVKKGRSKNIKLKYHSNLMKLPEKILNFWKEFKQINLFVSVDGFKELNNYIRHPSKWEALEKNLQTIKDWQAKGVSINLKISITVQMYNILHLDKLFSWIRSNNLDCAGLNILNKPECLNIHTLPKDLKLRVEERLLPFEKDFPLKGVVEYMNKEDWSDRYLKDFFSYTKFLDKSRGQNMQDHLPDLAEYKI